MTRQQVVLATRNVGKLAELRRIVAAEASDIQILGLTDVAAYPEPAETERTFEGNALLKARACVAATGLPALADDSGLAVDVLNQMPGVRSARWAGPGASDEENNALLLRQLADVAASRPDGAIRLCHGAGAAGRYRARPSRGDARPARCQSGRSSWVRLRSAVRGQRVHDDQRRAGTGSQRRDQPSRARRPCHPARVADRRLELSLHRPALLTVLNRRDEP